MVRAERGGVLFEHFKENGIVAIGWGDAGDIRDLSRNDMEEALRSSGRPGPDAKQGASVVDRFAHQMCVGDSVTTYDSESRIYLVGQIIGEARYVPERKNYGDTHPFQRKVNWQHHVARDDLSTPVRNSLGSISTLFKLGGHVISELVDRTKRASPDRDYVEEDRELEADSLTYSELEERARTLIADRVSSLSDRQMEELVAGLLRAMGYRSRVTPVGSDLGKDVLASPDGLGFEVPRIYVEAKHRLKTKTDAPTLRSFAHTLSDGDRGLFVSTGGFTKEARYEAERARNAVQLLSLEELIAELVDRYEALDSEARSLLPLRPIFWPMP